MIHMKVQLSRKSADGYVIPLGDLKIVSAVTDSGMIGCGAFDLAALDKFDCPAAKVGHKNGASIVSLQDLLEGTVKEVNLSAEKLGLKTGISGREALEML
ncbi:MAG: YunC family protein [Methanotrichaceae archaeon]|nr:YunC family protein [Methanotrichaceae archaeon]